MAAGSCIVCRCAAMSSSPTACSTGRSAPRLLLDNGYVPVISSLGADDQGNVYNINADTIAAEIAAHLQAEKLILLTDVDGILRDRNDPSSRIWRVTVDEAEALVKNKTVSAGMLPKIAAIARLIRRGVRSAHIING